MKKNDNVYMESIRNEMVSIYGMDAYAEALAELLPLYTLTLVEIYPEYKESGLTLDAYVKLELICTCGECDMDEINPRMEASIHMMRSWDKLYEDADRLGYEPNVVQDKIWECKRECIRMLCEAKSGGAMRKLAKKALDNIN